MPRSGWPSATSWRTRAWRGVSSGLFVESGGAGTAGRGGSSGGGLPDVNAQQVKEAEVFRAEVVTVPVQRDTDYPAAGSRHRDGELVVDLGGTVEVAVQAERAELAVAEEVGDPQRASVARDQVAGEDGVLRQVLPELLLAAGEHANADGLGMPGEQPGAVEVVIGARVGGDEPGGHVDDPGGKVLVRGSASRRVQLRQGIAEQAQIFAGHRHVPPDQHKQYCRYRNALAAAHS